MKFQKADCIMVSVAQVSDVVHGPLFFYYNISFVNYNQTFGVYFTFDVFM